MRAIANGLQRLGSAETASASVEALWDLRDTAYDEPAAWSAFSAEAFLQSLAEGMEQFGPDGGQIPSAVLARALARATEPPEQTGAPVTERRFKRL